MTNDRVIYEVEPVGFSAGRELFREIWFDEAFIGAAFHGLQPARLFVDSLERPEAAMLARSFEYYVAGSHESAALRAFIRDAPAEAGVFADLYGYAPANIRWTQTILSDHDGRLEVVPRRAFLWHDTEAAREAIAPWREPAAAVIVQEIDERLAVRLEHEIRENVGHFWGSRDEFLAKSFGYCTLVNDAPASIAYAIAIGSGEANIAVFTAPGFRRKGHAARACTAYIDHCLRLELVPTWDSDSDNPRSADLARKLGFREVPPFSQLSPLPGTKLDESTGLWTKEPRDDGIIAYRRR